MQHFILASASPRRKELLGLLGIPFRIEVAAVDEDSIGIPEPRQNVAARAQLKGAAVASAHPEEVTLAADTVVTLGSRMLNKPADAEEARHMLRALRESPHVVHTGLALFGPHWPEGRTAVVSTQVRMRPYADLEIEQYIASGDPFDKAGGYAIQHPGFQPVATLHGCFLNVMGLPVCHLVTWFDQLGLSHAVEMQALQQAHQNYPCATHDHLPPQR